MKRTLSMIALAVLTIGLLGSCSKINERLDNLDKRIDGIENEQIASINSQISGITSSISDLGQIRSDISSLKQSASDHSVDIFNLEEADRALKDRIVNLEDYVDAVLPNYAEKEWVEATFSTLEQYEATCDTIAKIDARIGALDAKLSKDIKACADSLTKWVNKQFEGYYTAAQMDAKLAQMKAAVDSAKASGGITDAKADSIATELTNAKAAVDTAKANIRAEYRAAIDTAIKASEGKLTKELTDAISEVNGKIESLVTRVDNLATEVDKLTGRVKALEEMIQSVVIVPAYSDGSVEAVDGILELNLVVSPSSAAKGLTKDNVKILLNKVATKAVSVDTVKTENISPLIVDETNGTVEIKANISENLPTEDGQALTVAVNVANDGISDFTTEFVPVYVTNRTFKAVYNTNGDANTLTFYYDDVDHSGEGITVYDNLPTAATKAADWGYNDKRGEIKSVVIDASVAGYKGLTSTAYMFQGMINATEISGAEYLYVSNVTDMSFMFNNFGGDNTTLNSVPNVSGWNTGNVTNMTGMFAYYGYSSKLDKVPVVSGWNTGKVTDMSLMFQKYGHESTSFNAVPDVSNWNTGNVTNMANIFYEYGHKSTSLDTVPDVSNWNTGKVENMQQMFYEYGNKSTVLNTVPNVSGWNTSNVTKISGLFNGYGHTSNNIDCTLDLSGWDLSEITGTNGNNVFAFTPKTFDVTIPAKTGEKSNEGGVWYYGDGTNSIAPPAGKTFTLLPAGALKGVFTVSADGKKVHFSQGNLQATYNSSTSTYTWGFAPNQYDYIGNAAGNTTIDSQTNGAVVDLFGWSTDAASNNWGIHTKDASTYTTGNFKDWGEAIDNKGTWRTLSGGPGSEWGYLCDNHVHVYGTCNNVPGVFIAPDGFVGDASALSEAIKDWESALATGIIFLPAAGYRCGSEVDSVGGDACYWSSNLYNNSNAFSLSFYFNGIFGPSSVLERCIGGSVRLVTEVK